MKNPYAVAASKLGNLRKLCPSKPQFSELSPTERKLDQLVEILHEFMVNEMLYLQEIRRQKQKKAGPSQ